MRLKIPYLTTKKGQTDTQLSERSVLEDRYSTFICLVGIFIIAFFLRSYFALEMSTKFGTPFLLTGGSDAYYYERIVEYIGFNNRHLLYDPMINFPMGVTNPRPPFYGWTTVLSAHLFAPFVGGFTKSLHYTLILSTAFWGALTIFPTYFVGRDIFGKRAGIAAAFFLAISAGHLQRSPIGNADHDAIYLFFAVTGFYFLMKALKGIPDNVKWVESWGDKASVKEGLSRFISQNKKPLLYAAMAGMCFGTVALSWQGWAYIVVIVLTYYYIQLLIDRVRYRDSIGVTMCVMVSLVICVVLAAPFYYGAGTGAGLPHRIGTWYDVPLIIVILGLIGGVILTATRDYPWILIYSILTTMVVGILLFAVYVSPELMDVFLSGAGYFARTKAYDTIAEAQAPEFSNIVLSFGPATFFLSMAGIFLAIWHLKGRWDTQFLFILVWTAFAIYMSLSAARFIFNGSPAFALTAGWVTALIVDKSKFQDISYRLSRSKGNFFAGLKRGVSVTHVIAVLVVIFMLILPNVMSGLDAGIPFERKAEYDGQVYRSMPTFLRPDDYNETRGDVWHFGAFGFGIDKPTDYWPAAWDWLDDKNSHLHPYDRPAFLSWWDYGFESVARGNTPTVADNFLYGHQLAGNVLMAQSESEVLSLLIGRMLEAPFREERAFEGDIRNILERHLGKDKTDTLEDVYLNPADYRDEVLSNPDLYHPRADDISNANIRYAKTMGLLSVEDHDTLVQLYHDITNSMDKIIQYIAVDSRLFPFSGRQTGIFYAPAKLSDHRMDVGQGMRTPVDFFTIYFVDEFGNEYDDPGDIPPGVNIVDYDIRYHEMFYNSMLYRTFVGYAGHWVGERESIPAVNNENLHPMPGWGLTNFKMSYRTAYFNPYPPEEVHLHRDAWKAVSMEKAIEYQEKEIGTVDLSPMSSLSQGVVFLEYYHGAILSGQVTCDTGKPISGARVTVLDDMGVPHGTTYTDEKGEYSTYAPPGEINVVVSTGGEAMKLQMIEEVTLGVESFYVTRDQAMRKRVDRSGDGRWDYLIDLDFQVETSTLEGHIFMDISEDGKYQPDDDIPVPGKITAINEQQGIELVHVSEDGFFEFSDMIPGKYILETNIEGTSAATIKIEAGDIHTKDIEVRTGTISGYAYVDEDMVSDIELYLENIDTGYIRTTGVDDLNMSYLFSHIPPGSYKLEVINDDHTIRDGAHAFNMPPGGNLEANVTIVQAAILDGTTRLDHRILPNQRLIFSNVRDPLVPPQTTTSDKEGYFSIKLPIGEYNVQGTYQKNSDVYVFMGRAVLPYAEETMVADFSEGHKVSGVVEFEGRPLEEYRLIFQCEKGLEAEVYTNIKGEFSLTLPEGYFMIYGMNIYGEDTYHRSHINVESHVSLNLEARSGYRAEGIIYRDLDKDGEFTQGEGIEADITVTYADDFEMTIPAGVDGSYSLVLPDGERTSLYYHKDGFLSKGIEVRQRADVPEFMPLYARNVTLSGDIVYPSHIVPEKLPVTFQPVGAGAEIKEVDLESGIYSVSLQPGNYVIDIDYEHDDGEIFYYSQEITINIGSDRTLDIEPEYKVRLIGNVITPSDHTPEAQIHMVGPEDIMMYVNDTFEIYLIPGTYTLWADDSENQLVNISTLQVSSPTTFDLLMEEGIEFTPFITYDGEPRYDLPVFIECLNTGYVLNRTTDMDGTFKVLLPPGEYEVSVDHISREPVDGIPREVHYHYLDVYDMHTSTAPAIPLTRDFINATLTGQLTIAGERMGGVEIEFIAISPDAMSTTAITDNDGNFELELSQGSYTLYSSHTGPRGLFVEMSELIMTDEDKDLDIDLKRGAKMLGTVRRTGDGVPAEVTISDMDTGLFREFNTDDNGFYEIILPAGEYHITAYTTITEDGVDKDYEYSRAVDLKYSMELDINLEILRIYSMNLEMPEERWGEQGQSVSFTVQVNNTGNTRDSYTFSAAPTAIWDLDFSPRRLEVPAGELRDLTVTVHLSDDAPVSHPPIEMMAESENSHETASLQLPINVIQRYGVSMEPEVTSRQIDSGKLIYTLTIENTGNGDDIFDIEILNREYLRTRGWNVTVSPMEDKIADGVLEEINVIMTPQKGASDRNLAFEIEVTSRGDPDASTRRTFDIRRPSLISDLHGVDLISDDVSFDRISFAIGTWHWAIIVVLVALGGYYIIRKKRWI